MKPEQALAYSWKEDDVDDFSLLDLTTGLSLDPLCKKCYHKMISQHSCSLHI